jgi:hypothetical protein
MNALLISNGIAFGFSTSAKGYELLHLPLEPLSQVPFNVLR